jgi:cation diffusion facilitator CzcD-associated flavoprotein CzcO
MAAEHFDVIIVGAGLSGVGAGCHLQKHCPGKRYLILEGREAMGGTWDLFRYPGIRSDSDMHTLGYKFKPWVAEKAIAEGPAILDYIHETAQEYGITQHIRYQHRVVSARWSSADACWTLEVQRGEEGERVTHSCNFLLMCAGYYRYREGFTPKFPDRERFGGEIIHPQHWPEDLDYTGKRVVIIGSGATAVTLLPAMAERAAHVVMLQRSPTYMIVRPFKDWIANALRKILPDKWAYALTRWKNVRLQQMLYRRTRKNPEQVRKILLERVRAELGPDYDVDTDFTPRYDPWDQRLCLVPDSDFFNAIKSGKASVVTDHIERFTESGILLQSGRELEADIIVTATGLNMIVMGEVDFVVDGKPVDFSETWTYKGLMYSGVPNLVNTFGYINASWTLRADLTAEYFCQLLNHMDALGKTQVTPTLRPEDQNMQPHLWVDDFSAGYMQRVLQQFPKQGDHEPWLNTQNYLADRKLLGNASFDDGALIFSNPAEDARSAA